MTPVRLRKIAFRGVYHSMTGALLDDFYIPALSAAVTYDRAVGYFSSAMLAYAAKGLSAFIRNSGKMRLVVGAVLSEEEFQAVKEGSSLRVQLDVAERRLFQILNDVSDGQVQARLELLCYLVAADRLSIRVAFTRRGMFHDKTGILTDSYGDKIVFQGSANETAAALLPDFNYESIAVYPSWKEDVFSTYGVPFEEEFEKVWEGQAAGVVTADLLGTTYQLLKSRAPKFVPAESAAAADDQINQGKPHLPLLYNGYPYSLKPHQLNALNAWKSASFKGIFNMATGAGKTVTSLHAAVTICSQVDRSIIVVIVVPYQNLADQWCEVAEQFGFYPIQAYRSISNWNTSLSDACSSVLLPGNKTHYCIVSVKNTFSSNEFQRLISKVPSERLMLIADECHHYAAPSYSKIIPNAKYVIGLSATPWRLGDSARQARLESLFGFQCFQYTIDDAMRDDVLCKYQYLPCEIYLTDDEYHQYSELSKEISKLFSMRDNGVDIDEEVLSSKLMARSRVLGSASEKIVCISKELSSKPIGAKTLFYCGDGSTEDSGSSESLRDIERVSEVLHRHGWKSSQFTAAESRNMRKNILDNFSDNFINALVSIRVLDEGIDIPACSEAYILASSRNERQYVQRRGRILRKSKGKDLATIHDYICLPPRGHVDSIGTSLVAAELMRFEEFARLAVNKEALDVVKKRLIETYGI